MLGKKNKVQVQKKRLRCADYAEMIDQELINALVEKKSELFAYLFQTKIGTLEKTHVLRRARVEIAWILTILRQRNINLHDHFILLKKEDVRKAAIAKFEELKVNTTTIHAKKSEKITEKTA